MLTVEKEKSVHFCYTAKEINKNKMEAEIHYSWLENLSNVIVLTVVTPSATQC